MTYSVRLMVRSELKILETGEISGLLAKIGVTAETIASGPLKDQPSLARPLDPRGRAALRAI